MPPFFLQQILHWMRVPGEPHAPAGAPASLKVFRAGRNYLKLRLWTWGLAQLAALAGIIFWTVVLLEVERTAGTRRAAAATERAATDTITPTETEPAATPPAKANKKARPRRNREFSWTGFKQGLVEVALRLPPWAFPLLWFAKVGGIALYLLQIPFTYAVRRLDYAMRWYVVTDRSLRIRAGIVVVQESTLSFANIQQVEVSQGPLQRLLGLADVRVQSAGGGQTEEGKASGDSLHTAVFHGVDNATEIRDLILNRLRRFRETGLGDPDEPVQSAADSGEAGATASQALAAAREVLAEMQALRRAV